MKQIKVYRCDCGEDVFEDDGACINCRKPVDPSRLKLVDVAEVTREVFDGATQEDETPPP